MMLLLVLKPILILLMPPTLEVMQRLQTHPLEVMLKLQAKIQPVAVKLWERAKIQPVAVIPQLVMMKVTRQLLQPAPLIRILILLGFVVQFNR